MLRWFFGWRQRVEELERQLAAVHAVVHGLEAAEDLRQANHDSHILDFQRQINSARVTASRLKNMLGETAQDAPGSTNGKPAGVDAIDREIARRKGY
jgi:hypothetical protein